MKFLTINFKDGDTISIDCLDVVINQSFLTVFMPEDKFGNKTVQGYNVQEISDFEFVQGEEEGVKENE